MARARNRGRVRTASWLRGLSGVKRVIAGAVAVAATVTALWGGFKAVTEAKQRYEKWQDEPSELFVSPNVGLQIWQDGAQNDMFLRDPDALPPIVRIPMKGRPFELRFPKQPKNVAVQITAWVDDSIFVVKEGSPELTRFFSGGTGMADFDFASGDLGVNNEAHNHFIDKRIAPESDRQDKVFVATLSRGTFPSREVTPLTKQNDDVFLVVHIDENRNELIDLGEYEYLVLDF